MAFNPSSFLLNLSPAGSLGLGDFAKDAMQISAQRKQMKLAREKFEFDKKQAEEEQKLRHIEEQGRMARSAMEAQQKREEAERVKAAALLAKQQESLMKFGELAGTGKVQQTDAMVPYLDQLGYDVNNLGNVGGLPVYQLLNRAQETERARQEQQARAGGDEMAGLGYPTNERGNLDDPNANRGPLLTDETQTFGAEGGEGDLDAATTEALMPGEADLATSEEFGGGEGVADVSVGGRGIGPASLSTGDAFAQALAASRYAEEHGGQAARGPDEEDYMGAVPRNVIDLPAMQAQTLARLNPALQARVASLPPELQEGAKANAAAIGGLGYETDAALKEFDTAMQDPVSIYNSQQNLLAQKEKGNELTRMEESTLQGRGAEKLESLYKERGIDKSLNAINKAAEVELVLDNDSAEDDGMVANAVMEAQNLKGAPSNTDLEFAFGIKKGSLLTQGIAIIEEAIRGGMSDVQKKAVRSYMKAVKETQDRNLQDYLDNAFDTIDNDRSLDPAERAGFKSRLERSVPPSIYNRYWEEREKREGPGGRRRGGQSTGEAGAELQRQAEAAGLNGQVLGQLMGGESGGDPKAANENRTDGGPKSSAKGVFQLTNETARAMGYPDAAAYQAEPVDKQIEVGLKLFTNKGLTEESPVEDYALVLAAPSLVGKWKSRDDVVYKKGSIEWEGNAPWRPAGGGDITVGSITDYYLKHGREVARERDAAESKAEAAPAKTTELKLPEPKTPQEKRYLELVAKKRGG